MKITVLGSGTVDPQPHRAGTGFFVESARGSLVLDLGPGTLRNAILAGLPMNTLETVVLTHFHPDHTTDLVPFLFARKYAPKPWNEAPPLKLFGPTGSREFVDKLFEAWPSLKPEHDQLEVIELKAGEPPRELSTGTTIEAFTALHGDMSALCYRICDGDKVVAFSGDTSLCAGVADAAKAADLFFCECSCFPRRVEPLSCRDVHLSWEDVAKICGLASPKRVILTHLYEVVLSRKPGPLESLKKTLTIPVELAADRAAYQV